MSKPIGKGLLLGLYFACCAFFLRIFWPYLVEVRDNFGEILLGTYQVPEIPENILISLVIFGIINVVFFAQIFQAWAKKSDDKKDD